MTPGSEVIQQACFLVILKLTYCFVPIPVLASKLSFLSHILEIISAKLVPELKGVSCISAYHYVQNVEFSKSFLLVYY